MQKILNISSLVQQACTEATSSGHFNLRVVNLSFIKNCTRLENASIKQANPIPLAPIHISELQEKLRALV